MAHAFGGRGGKGKGKGKSYAGGGGPKGYSPNGNPNHLSHMAHAQHLLGYPCFPYGHMATDHHVAPWDSVVDARWQCGRKWLTVMDRKSTDDEGNTVPFDGVALEEKMDFTEVTALFGAEKIS